MTARADGMRRIATANTTLATVSVAGVVGLSAMLAQQATHHTAASSTPVTTTSVGQPSTARSESSDDAPATTVTTAAPQATVQQAPSGSVQHVVTSGS